MGREFIGKGGEHTVVRSHTFPDYVLKKPLFNNLLNLKLLGMDVSVIREEVAESAIMAKNAGIRTPETRVYTLRGRRKLLKRLPWLSIPYSSYVIAQKFVEEDNTIPDIASYISENSNSRFFSIKSQHDPQNFRSNKGEVYWIDLTKANPTRFYIKLGFTWEEWEDCLNLLFKAKKFLERSLRAN